MNYDQKSLALHRKLKGQLATCSKVAISNIQELSVSYTPGIAEPCRHIAKNPALAKKLTSKANSVAVITDGTAVLGLGNIGPIAGLPVMEGKCILFKQFGNVDAWPICIEAKNTRQFIETVCAIAPGFGGINLEDVGAPACFEIEAELKRRLDIPVFHDDQHGTAIVSLAALINACKITGRDMKRIKVAISGAGAAGLAIAKILLLSGIKNIVICDRTGTIYTGRKNMDRYKKEMARKTNPEQIKGSLADALVGADVFIGVSAPRIVTRDMAKRMNKNSIIFAMSNPIPEIDPVDAAASGAAIIATGRSDQPNQINNVLAFPGIFRGAFDSGAREITDEMKIAAAHALARLVKKPTRSKIIPSVFHPGVAKTVAHAVKKCAPKRRLTSQK